MGDLAFLHKADIAQLPLFLQLAVCVLLLPPQPPVGLLSLLLQPPAGTPVSPHRNEESGHHRAHGAERRHDVSPIRPGERL